jgi:hypothetical protein
MIARETVMCRVERKIIVQDLFGFIISVTLTSLISSRFLSFISRFFFPSDGSLPPSSVNTI